MGLKGLVDKLYENKTMPDRGMSRREFLKRTGMVVGAYTGSGLSNKTHSQGWKREVYLVDLPEDVCIHGWAYGGNPKPYLHNLWQLLGGHADFDVMHITTMKEFDKLLRKPPARAGIIVAHGNQFPVPERYIKNSNIIAEKFLGELAAIVNNSQWVLGIEGGYPFFVLQNSDVKIANGKAIETFLQNFDSDYRANCWPWVVRGHCFNGHITEEGRGAADIADFNLPDRAAAGFGSSISKKPEHIFYSNGKEGPFGSYESVVAHNFGKGFFIHSGLYWEDMPEAEPKIYPPARGEDIVKIGLASYLYSMEQAKQKPSKTYVLNSEGVDKWVNAEILKKLLTSKGIRFEELKTCEEFERLIESEEKNVSIFNCHGPCVPCPPSLYKDAVAKNYPMKGHVKYLWENVFLELGRKVSRDGWTWVHFTAYPFFHIMDKSKGVHWYSDDLGLILFLRAASNGKVTGESWAREKFSYEPGMLSAKGKEISDRYDLDLAEFCIGVRAMSTNAPLITSIYETTGKTPGTKKTFGPYDRYRSIAAYRIGDGAYLHCGLDGSELVKAPGMAAALLRLWE